MIYGARRREDAAQTTAELHFSLFLQQKMKIFFKLQPQARNKDTFGRQGNDTPPRPAEVNGI